MIKILFVCHGNICRSPMAEFIFKDMLKKRGLSDLFYAESRATSTEELGDPVYPPARRMLEKHGISCAGKRAILVSPADCDEYDLLICMDQYNVRNLRRYAGERNEYKIHLMLEYADRPGESVDDPWYSGDFQAAWDDIAAGCEGILSQLTLVEVMDRA